MKTVSGMFEVWSSTKNTENRLRLKTKCRIEAEVKFKKCARALGKTRGGVNLIGTDGKCIKLYWYSEWNSRDRPIQGRHYASHSEYLFKVPESKAAKYILDL